jgi:hypothetical protein
MTIEEEIDLFLSKLRVGEKMPGALHRGNLAKLPVIDAVRERLRESDIDWIIAGWSVDDMDDGGITFALLSRFTTHPKVERFVLEQWSLSTEYSRKQSALWAMVNIPDLPLEKHREAFRFVEENLDRFTAGCRQWWGGPSGRLDTVRWRMGLYPREKAWLYMCAAMDSDDRNALVGFMNEMANDTAGINAEVAKRLLARIEQ